MVESRKEREARIRRNALLEAAEEVFAEHGYAGASMEQVAKRAEYAVGTLYNVFKSKEVLLGEMMQAKAELISPTIEGILQSNRAPREKILACTQARIDFFWEHPRFHRIYFSQTLDPLANAKNPMSADIRVQYEQFRGVLTALFTEGMANDEFRQTSPEILAVAIEGILAGYLADLCHVTEPVRDADSEAALLEVILLGCAGSSDVLKSGKIKRSEKS